MIHFRLEFFKKKFRQTCLGSIHSTLEKSYTQNCLSMLFIYTSFRNNRIWNAWSLVFIRKIQWFPWTISDNFEYDSLFFGTYFSEVFNGSTYSLNKADFGLSVALKNTFYRSRARFGVSFILLTAKFPFWGNGAEGISFPINVTRFAQKYNN